MTTLDMMGAPSNREVRHDQNLCRVWDILRDAAPRSGAREVLLPALSVAAREVGRDGGSANRAALRRLWRGLHVALAERAAGEVLLASMSGEALERDHGEASASTMDSGGATMSEVRRGVHANDATAAVVWRTMQHARQLRDREGAQGRGAPGAEGLRRVRRIIHA